MVIVETAPGSRTLTFFRARQNNLGCKSGRKGGRKQFALGIRPQVLDKACFGRRNPRKSKPALGGETSLGEPPSRLSKWLRPVVSRAEIMRALLAGVLLLVALPPEDQDLPLRPTLADP